MSVFLRAISAALISVIAGLLLRKYNQDMAMLVSIASCIIILILTGGYLGRVLEFLQRLKRMAQYDSAGYTLLIKAMGVGMLTQIAALICADGGHQAAAKALQILGTAVMLSLAIPVLDSLLDLLESFTGEL